MNDAPAQAPQADTPATEGNPAAGGDTPYSAWSRIMTVLSTISMASLISLFVGLCYFYDRSYRQAYYGQFGLDADVVPISLPDAVVAGFFGIVANVMMVVVIFAACLLVYVVLIWFLSRRLEKFALRWGIPASQPLPHPALVQLGTSLGFRTSFIATLGALVTLVVSMVALFLIGVPAERAAAKDGDKLRAKFASTKAECARFVVKGGGNLVGWRIGSSPERQFILGNDDAVHVLKFDDLERMDQTPVRCRAASPTKPLARERRLPGGGVGQKGMSSSSLS